MNVHVSNRSINVIRECVSESSSFYPGVTVSCSLPASSPLAEMLLLLRGVPRAALLGLLVLCGMVIPLSLLLTMHSADDSAGRSSRGARESWYARELILTGSVASRSRCRGVHHICCVIVLSVSSYCATL